MIDQSHDELRSALKSDGIDKRFMAAFVIGERRLPWHQELIALLTDASDPVRQAARRGLIILSFLALNPEEARAIALAVRNTAPTPFEQLNPPVDFGPAPGANKAAQKKAAEQWTDWWHKPRSAAKQSASQAIPAEFPVETNPERLADAFLKANQPRQKELLGIYRDGDGAQHSEALAIIIDCTKSNARGELREALQARLARSNDRELRTLLDNDLAEIRRAALHVLAKKDSKNHVGRFVAMLLDPEPKVRQAAHAVLCKLSGDDFGPKPGATEAELQEAMRKWEDWCRTAKLER